jgi:predicted nuclease of predicted toxin-antitoxin system
VAKFKFLLDNDVRHLQSVLPERQAVQLEEVGLSGLSCDDEIVEVASVKNLLIVTNNQRDFQQEVVARIGESRKGKFDCTQVHGLVIIVPSDAITQKRVLAAAAKNLIFEGKPISWKAVYEQCLRVVIEASGAPKITRLPRCHWCKFDYPKAS